MRMHSGALIDMSAPVVSGVTGKCCSVHSAGSGEVDVATKDDSMCLPIVISVNSRSRSVAVQKEIQTQA